MKKEIFIQKNVTAFSLFTLIKQNFPTGFSSSSKFKSLKMLFLLGLGMFSILCSADEIKPEQIASIVTKQVNNLSGIQKAASVRPVQSYFMPSSNTPMFYVISLDGGGFVVISADSEIEPIIAMSESGDFSADPHSPLFAVLNQDLSARMQNIQERRQRKTSSFIFDDDVNQAVKKWDYLLSSEENPLSYMPSDVRVEPLVESTWNQGEGIYDYYTSGYPAGCVATATAQIMRYWEYPKRAVPRTYEISVGEIVTNRTMKGGIYNWANMPLRPIPGLTSEEKAEAIGKLLHDVGTACHMNYAKVGSGSYGELASNALRETFGYQSSVSYSAKKNEALSKMLYDNAKPSILGSLDAESPVQLGIIGGKAGGHSIVGDGYGFNSGTLYVHLNLGWGGDNNAWYNLPKIYANEMVFTILSNIVYNISPTGSGEIISGRVLKSDGTPFRGSAVTVFATDGADSYMASPSVNTGIFAIRVPSPASAHSYKLSVQSTGDRFFQRLKTVTVLSSKSDDYKIEKTSEGIVATSSNNGIIGTSWGNDLFVNLNAVEGISNGGTEELSVVIPATSKPVKPIVLGTYTPESKKTKLRVVNYSAAHSKITVELNKDILLYNKKELASSYHKLGKFTDSFLFDKKQDTSIIISLTGRVGKMPLTINQHLMVVPPSLDSISVIESGADSSISIGAKSVVTLYGFNFGKKLPKVWLEYLRNGKVKKLKLKIDKNPLYRDAFGKRFSYTDPISGRSQLTATMPKKLPADLTPDSVAFLVLDSGSGLISVRVQLK